MMTRSATSKQSPASPARQSERPGRWPLQDAKARFSELVRVVLNEGPQLVTLHGHDTVAVVSVDEFHRLKGDRTGKDLVAALRAAPHRAHKLEPKRAPMPVRNVKL